MPRAAVVVVVSALVLVPAGSAAAALPDIKGKKITSSSIGGVKLGMSLAKVQAVWGAGGYDYSMDAACDGANDTGTGWECTWQKTPRTKAWVGFEDGRAAEIGIAGSKRSLFGRLKAPGRLGLGTPGRYYFTHGFTSYPAGLGAPVPGVGAVYTKSSRALRNITFFVGRSGPTVAIAVG